ncbi:hypothetical protein [Psychromonas ingrahamii]|nr:hypothetical protein [Psychromonas ingrahamii]
MIEEQPIIVNNSPIKADLNKDLNDYFYAGGHSKNRRFTILKDSFLCE